MSNNHPRPVRSILCRYAQHHIGYEAAISMLLLLGVSLVDASYYLQAGDYEYSWETA